MIKKYKMFINGSWIEGKRHFSVRNPYNNELIGECCAAEPEDVEEAIKAANQSFKTFSLLPAYIRSEILAKTARIIDQRKEEVAKTIVLESGKAWKYAVSEVARSVETFNFAAEETKQIHGSMVPMDVSSGGINRTALNKPFPIGVVAAITPFNFPLNLVAHKVAPAIAAGNTIVLKPASSTPLTSLLLGKIMAEAGLPDGALNIIMGSGRVVGDILTTHPDIALISFTGSPPVGLSIKGRCGMKKVVLELGSNAAVIVEPDATLATVIPRSITGAFANSGQVCISLQRIYVHTDIFDEFSTRLVEAAKMLKVGDPIAPDTDYGPLIEEKETTRIMSWIEEAVSQGAHCACGGKLENNILLPTIMTKVTHAMKVCSQEAFAPVVCLMRYNSFEEAIRMVNDSEFGLQAGVYTRDITKAFYAYEQLDVGGVMINDIPTYRTDNMPYGGVKMSGTGREGVKYAIEEMMKQKLLVINLAK